MVAASRGAPLLSVVCGAIAHTCVRRGASTVAHSNVGGWVLDVNLPAGSLSAVVASPGWRETLEVSRDGSRSEARTEVDETNEAISVSAEAGAAGETLRLAFPQRMDAVHVDAGRGDVSIAGKLEADTNLTTRSGRVDVASPLRGTYVTIAAGRGAVQVHRVVEAGQLDVSCGSMRATRVMGENIVVRVGAEADEDGSECEGEGEGIHIESSYATKASYTCVGRGSVTVGGHHGVLHASASSGDVHATGITGAASVSAEKGEASLQFDSVRGDSSCVAEGDILLTLVPPVLVRLVMAAPNGVILKPGLTGVFRTDEDANDAATEKSWGTVFDVRGTLVVRTPAPDLSAHAGGVPLPTPFPAGGNAEEDAPAARAATPEPAPARGGSGKIRDDVPVSGFYSPPAAAEGQAGAVPTITVRSTGGAITVEAVSWVDLVKRRV